MSPRSALLLVALLLAASAAAQWSDVLFSLGDNKTVKKLCAVDNPNYCYFVPVINASLDVDKAYVVAMYYDPYTFSWNAAPVVQPQTIMIFYNDFNVTVYTPEGYILAPTSVYVDGVVPDKMPLCGKNRTAVKVTADYHRIYGRIESENVYFLNPKDCSVYTLVIHEVWLVNVTSPWAYVYEFYMPTAREVYMGQIAGAYVAPYWDYINGTMHRYHLQVRLGPLVGKGIYIANRTRIPAIAVQVLGASVWAGPVAFDMLNAPINTDYNYPKFTIYTIGQYPGDGVAAVGVPYFMTLAAPAELVYISDDAAGYFKITVLPDENYPAHLFVRRYAIAEVALSDGIYTYTTRTIACPPYENTTVRHIFTVPTRVDIAKEIEICNNKTSAVYLALQIHRDFYDFFNFIDRVEPGKCNRLRWDGSITVSDTKIYVYPSAEAVCRWQNETVLVGGQNYIAGYRYYLMPDNSLVAANPIDLDTLYAEMWKQIIQSMAQQYNETVKALQQWLQMQANATKSIEDYYKSLPQYQGTIKMDSSTSTWLQTVYNVIKSYVAPGAAGQFAPIAVQPPPAAVAPAAAAAVAVAWAASRRDDDVVTTAAVAGIALALFGILMSLVYGADSLTLVALGVVIAAAAAAWKKI